MKKSQIFFICLSILTAVSLSSCEGDEAGVVSKIPDGFVSLIDLNSNADNILRCVLWETQISFMDDEDNVCIYQASFVNNHNLVIKYKNEYYINEEKYMELDEIAAFARKERKRTYKMGETVEILGLGKRIYTVKIISLEFISAEPYYEDYLAMFKINYEISSSESENENIRINTCIVTRDGVEHSNNFLHADEGSTNVKIRMQENDLDGNPIESIILISPEYPGLTHRVLTE